VRFEHAKLPDGRNWRALDNLELGVGQERWLGRRCTDLCELEYIHGFEVAVTLVDVEHSRPKVIRHTLEQRNSGAWTVAVLSNVQN